MWPIPSSPGLRLRFELRLSSSRIIIPSLSNSATNYSSVIDIGIPYRFRFAAFVLLAPDIFQEYVLGKHTTHPRGFQRQTVQSALAFRHHHSESPLCALLSSGSDSYATDTKLVKIRTKLSTDIKMCFVAFQISVHLAM